MFCLGAVGGDPDNVDPGFTGGVQVDVYMHYAQLLHYTATPNTLEDLGVSGKWLKYAHVKPPRPSAADFAAADSPPPPADSTRSTLSAGCNQMDDGAGGSTGVAAGAPVGGPPSGVATPTPASATREGDVAKASYAGRSEQESVSRPHPEAAVGRGPHGGVEVGARGLRDTNTGMHSTAPVATAALGANSCSGADTADAPGASGAKEASHIEPPAAPHEQTHMADAHVDGVGACAGAASTAPVATSVPGSRGSSSVQGAASSASHASAQVKRSQLYDIAGFLRSQLWLGCYRGPPPLGVDLFVIISMYYVNWDGTGVEKPRRIPQLAAGLLATRTATMHEAMPGCTWMGDISVEGAVGRARLEAKECLGAQSDSAHACHHHMQPTDPCPEGADGRGGAGGQERGTGAEEEMLEGCGRWVHLREWFEAVQECCGGDVGALGADFVLVRSYGETVLGRAAAELWLSSEGERCATATCACAVRCCAFGCSAHVSCTLRGRSGM